MYVEACVVVVGAICSVLRDKLVDAYLHYQDAKELWDALDDKFGASDAGSELYVMEQFFDYKMVANRSVVEQAHELLTMTKEFGQFKCPLPDKFVVGGIIAKLPLSWRNFATSLKHKRQEISVENLIGTLDVEEKARAKDAGPKGNTQEGTSTVNMVQRNNHNNSNNKGKGKAFNNAGPKNTTTFKKKKKKGGNKDKDFCFVCGGLGHWASNCKEHKG